MERKSILLLLVSLMLSACSGLYRVQGDFHYENLSYQKASSYYEKALKKKDIAGVQERLAECYRLTSRPAQSESLYKHIVEGHKHAPAEKVKYAQSLMQTGEYVKARIWLKQYLQLVPQDVLARNMVTGCDSSRFWTHDSSFVIEMAPLPGTANEGGSNFGVAYMGEDLIFASERKGNWWTGPAEWTGRNYLDLYTMKRKSGGGWEDPVPLEGEINSLFHEGPVAFSRNQDTVWFSRSDITGKKRGHDLNDENKVQLFYAVKNSEGWGTPQKFSWCEPEHSYGHPALSPDGNLLVFVSDKPGGEGATDLYWSKRNASGAWEKPQPAGAVLNSPGAEMFPWFGKDSTLYFASDGLPGLGGLDLFRSKLSKRGWSIPENLKAPLNSTRDDFNFIFNNQDSTGFLSSNRDSDDGLDALYGFSMKRRVIIPEPPKVELFVEGLVFDKERGVPLAGARVELRSPGKGLVADTLVGEDGVFRFRLDKEMDYSAVASAELFLKNSADFSTKGQTTSRTWKIRFDLDSMVVGKPIVLRDIYYDFDKWYIRPDAEPDLNRLINTMSENPNIRIELSSHTDCRGSDAYNETLSQKRAQSAVDYIVNHGIDRGRMVAKGYGESKLLNNCDDGVPCSEEEHQLNRRTEFKIIQK